jgi:hypothetical protein
LEVSGHESLIALTLADIVEPEQPEKSTQPDQPEQETDFVEQLARLQTEVSAATEEPNVVEQPELPTEAPIEEVDPNTATEQAAPAEPQTPAEEEPSVDTPVTTEEKEPVVEDLNLDEVKPAAKPVEEEVKADAEAPHTMSAQLASALAKKVMKE